MYFKKIKQRISKKIRQIKEKRYVKSISYDLASVRQLILNNHLHTLQNQKIYRDDKCLMRYGHKIYSQNEEDGIIQEIFNRIGTTNKIFVEFGIGDGLENNTLALLLKSWKGLWIEGSSNAVEDIRNHFKSVISNKILIVKEAFITCENINELISTEINEKEIDLLSIDIDGNDVHVFNAISVINPRVVVIEYNAKFPPPIKFSVEYDPSYTWQGDDYMGSSLKYLEQEFDKKGYRLVGCNLSGANSFFVRADLIERL